MRPERLRVLLRSGVFLNQMKTLANIEPPLSVEEWFTPITTKVEGSKKGWINRQYIHTLERPLANGFTYEGKEYIVVVNKGVLTNFATVPYFLRIFIHPDNRYVKTQAIIHDALVDEFDYNTELHLVHGIRPYLIYDVSQLSAGTYVNPKFADIIFRELIEIGAKYDKNLSQKRGRLKAGVAYGALTLYRWVYNIFN